MWLLWLVVGITFSIAEVIYHGVLLVWFAIGSFVTLATCFFTHNPFVQFFIFLTISITLLILNHKKSLHKPAPPHQTLTAVDSLKGKKGIVIKALTEDFLNPGLVKLDGELWHAVSTTGETIAIGSTVLIEDVKGIRLLVSIA